MALPEKTIQNSQSTPDRQSNAAIPSALHQYRREIGQIHMLSAAEEKRLARILIQDPSYKQKATELMEEQKILAALRKETEKAVMPQEVAKLREEERNALAEVIKIRQEMAHTLGGRAFLQLVETNLRYVAHVAEKMYAQEFQAIFSDLDLIQEGNIGLMKAVMKFDPEKGFRLTTYATAWIKQAISRAIDEKARTIRLPVHVGEAVRKMHKAKNKYYQENGQYPTAQQLAAKLKIPEETVMHLQLVMRTPRSTEEPLEDEDLPLGNTIEDDGPCPDEIVSQTLLTLDILKALKTLSTKEQRVLLLRYGFGNTGHERTQQEIARELGLSHQSVSQAEQRGIAKLRHPSRSQSLLDWVE